MAKPYTDEDLIKTIRGFVELEGRIPQARDFRKNKDYPDPQTYYNRFGSWNRAIELAGFSTNKSSKKVTKEECITSILCFYEEYNKVPTTIDFISRKPCTTAIKNCFGSWNRAITKSGLIPTTKTPHSKYTKEELLNYLWDYIAETGNIPKQREFNSKSIYPDYSTYQKFFGSWNSAILAAGYEPNYNDGYGSRTIGLDGYLYRSWNEAAFADRFLYKVFEYIVEPKYPKPHNKFYDWYLPELDLYIELDGGLRPKTIKEKIEINNQLGRSLLIVTPKDLNKSNLLDLGLSS